MHHFGWNHHRTALQEWGVAKGEMRKEWENTRWIKPQLKDKGSFELDLAASEFSALTTRNQNAQQREIAASSRKQPHGNVLTTSRAGKELTLMMGDEM